jgi:hypothetical protein
MTDDERQTYAAAQRLACMPMECVQAKDCWVAVGGREALDPRSLSATPRCAACHGKLLIEQWRTPAGFKLPPHGRLLSRHARSREPDTRQSRVGDRGKQRGGVSSTTGTPASGGV